MADRLLLGNLDCETHFAAQASPGREEAAHYGRLWRTL